MASGVTNRGKKNILDQKYRAATRPTNYYVALCDDSITPDADDNTKADVAEVPNGTGYTTGGISLTPGATDFDVLTEDDANDRALIQIKNLVWTASGGTVPTSGTGARWAVLTDDNATQNSREVEAWWDLVSNRIVSDGQTLTLVDCELRLT
jgi:hypothetical protein